MSEEEIILANMLIHGHSTDVRLLELSDKLIDYAVMLAKNEDYEKSDFEPTSIRSKLVLMKPKIFLRKNFVLHKVSYADEATIKLKLHGKMVKNGKELIKLYNGIGTLVDPLEIPVKFVDEPYYYGNLSLLTSLSEEPDFLKRMKLFFKSIELGKNTNEMTGVCYVHEIVHTQLESLKGIVRDYYNSEVLSIFVELLYAADSGPILLKEALKNRINMFLTEFHSLYVYIQNGECVSEDAVWHNVIACKYIVSTIKAFHLFNNYYMGDEIEKNNILWMVQKVFSGALSVELLLEELRITYDNSLEKEHVLSLIDGTKTP